jgi:hypothetical protein
MKMTKITSKRTIALEQTGFPWQEVSQGAMVAETGGLHHGGGGSLWGGSLHS